MMTRWIASLLTLSFLIMSPPRAYAFGNCNSTPWVQGRFLSKADMYQALTTTARATLVENAFFEMTLAKKDSVLLPLALYLANTEEDKDLRGFWRLMATIQAVGKRPETLYAKWPDERGTAKFPLQSWEICRAYNKGLELAKQNKNR